MNTLAGSGYLQIEHGAAEKPAPVAPKIQNVDFPLAINVVGDMEATGETSFCILIQTPAGKYFQVRDTMPYFGPSSPTGRLGRLIAWECWETGTLIRNGHVFDTEPTTEELFAKLLEVGK